MGKELLPGQDLEFTIHYFPLVYGEHGVRFGNRLGSRFRSRDELPGGSLAQQAGNQLGVHGVTGAFRNHVTD
jgi:hypothetical protein